VTHPEATRYFLTMRETCAAIASLAHLQDAAGLYLPEMGDPIFILELAERMIRARAAASRGNLRVKITGLRPGDKVQEDLLSHGETVGAEVAPGIRAIHGEKIHTESLDAHFLNIEGVTKRRDLGALWEILPEVIAEYRPTPNLRKKCVLAAAGAGDD
jgi:FlaA1/EpsC-like NDP-sugar epimerase